MAESDTNLQRRQLLKLSSAVVGGLALAGSAPLRAASQEPAVVHGAGAKPIRINFNENPLGMSPKAQEAAKATIGYANRYPMEEIDSLRQLLAKQYQLPGDRFLITAGASEGIRAAVEAYAVPGSQLVLPELTYGDCERYAVICGMKITKVPMKGDWLIDIDAMKKAVANHAGPSLVYLVNPNNPTSAIVAADEVEPWIQSKPANTMFLVDEAYAEFVADAKFRSVAPLLKQGADNLILLKTFSKIFAMAGMRVGYAVSQPAQINKLSGKVAGELINFPGLNAAIASLQDQAFINYSKASNDTARKILLQALDTLKVNYVPPQGNFVFHKLKIPLAEFQQHMQAAGVLVGRPFPPADEWCRISLGTPEQMTYVAQVLLDFRSKGWI